MTVIEVTQDHIDHGQRGSGSHCPIALAINAALGDDTAEVLGHTINLYNPDDWDAEHITIRADDNIYNWVDQFDRGQSGQPATLQFDPEAGTIKIINQPPAGGAA